MTERTDAERIRILQELAEALDAQRRETANTCAVATQEMSTAWVAGRNADRRISTNPHEGPERRRRYTRS